MSLAYREQIASGGDLRGPRREGSRLFLREHGGDLGFFGPGKMQKAFEVGTTS